MEKNLFVNPLGKLIKIDIQGEYDWSFVPDSLPIKWEIPDAIWPLLMEAHKEVARLDGIGRHMPEYELLLNPLQNREALKSSSIEGTYATPQQLLLFDMDTENLKIRRDNSETQEVSNYRDALRLGQKMLNDIPVSLRLLKALHETLLKGVRGNQRNPGNFRKTQVHIGSDRRFIPPTANEAIRCLNDLEKYIHEDKDIDPLIFCFMVHYQFETIHPFSDGNGRVGRLLLSLMIHQWLGLTNPWLYLSAFFDRYKDEYISNLFNVSARGDWSGWIAYCLRATAYQAKDTIKRFDSLIELRDNYFGLISQRGGNIRIKELVEHLFRRPAITVPEWAKKSGISYPTASSDLKSLCDLGILDEFKDFRPKLFFSSEIINIAFKDAD